MKMGRPRKAKEERKPLYKAQVTIWRVNVREKPTKLSQPVGELRHGDKIFVTDEVDGWAELSVGGYVDMTYIERMK